MIMLFCFCYSYAQTQASKDSTKQFSELNGSKHSNNLELTFSNGLTVKCFSYALNRDKKVTVYFMLSDGRLVSRQYDVKIVMIRTLK